MAYALYHRAVALEADDVGGTLVAAYDLRGMENLHAGGVVLLALELFPDGGLVAAQDDLKVGKDGERGEGAFYVCLGAVVASEAVNYNACHTSFLT